MANPFGGFSGFGVNQLRQQNVLGQQQPQQNMTRGVLDFQDLIGSGAITDADQQLPVSPFDINSIIGPTHMQPGQMQAPPQPQRNGMEELINLTNRLYTPQTQATERFNKLLDSAPQMNDPTFGRGLMSGLINLGANSKGKELIENSNSVLYAPYMREQAAWNQKVAPFQQAASLENSANVNERTLASNMANSWTAQQRNEENARIAQQRIDETERANRAREANTEFMNTARRLALMNPTERWDFTGPTAIIMRRDGSKLDTGMPSSKFDPVMQAELASAGRLNPTPSMVPMQPNAGGPPVNYNPRTGTTTPSAGAPAEGMRPVGATPAKEDDAQETGRKRMLALGELYVTDPGAAEFITDNGDGSFSIKERPITEYTDGGYFGREQFPDQNKIDAYNRILKRVFPEAPPLVMKPGTRQRGAPPTPAPGLAPGNTPITGGWGAGAPPVAAPAQAQAPQYVQPSAQPSSRFAIPTGNEPTKGLAPSATPQQVAPQQTGLIPEAAPEWEAAYRNGDIIIGINPNTGELFNLPNTPQNRSILNARGVSFRSMQ